VAACAHFCAAALHSCLDLKVIATSREPLGVPGETRWHVSSMREVDAVQLFEDRARLVVPDFNVTASNLDLVTNICARLDGIPLAIELAAARLGMMTEQELLGQLSDRFHLLTGGNRTAPDRHQTMMATLDWSYRLLSEGEALLFRRLSVFRGGFTLESAQAVWGGEMPGPVLDLVSGLVQKSMVVAERAEGVGSRYRLLESQLAYAEDRLIEAGELDLARRRHYDYFQDSLVAKMNPDPGRPPSGLAESRWLASELGNLWAAMDWATNNADDRGLALASELSSISFGDKDRLRPLLAELIDRSPERRLLPRLKALRSASLLAIWQGDYEGGAQSADASLALARELGDALELAHSLISAGMAHAYGEPDTSNELYQELISYLNGPKSRSIAAATRTSLMATVSNNLGWMALIRGDYTTARESLVESVSTARAEENAWDICGYLDSLAWAQWGLTDNQMAAASFKEALALARDLIAKPLIVGCLEGLSCVAGASGNHHRALKLAGAVHRLSGEWSVRPEPWVEMQTEQSQRLCRTRLGTHTSESAWKQGRAMTGDQAIDYALGESEPETLVDTSPLSSREREVATLVANGLTNRQIAARLFIAERSAEGHVERIRNKLGVRSRTEVATWAVERGLITTPLNEKEAGPTLPK
jgi:predicted ATPase/DNA-binding CsgD family transcriptional regulator